MKKVKRKKKEMNAIQGSPGSSHGLLFLRRREECAAAQWVPVCGAGRTLSLPTGLARGRLSSSGWLCHPERGHQPHVQEQLWERLSPALLPSAQCHPGGSGSCVSLSHGKDQLPSSSPLSGAAIQPLRLGHVLISQDRDALQGTGRYPTHFSLMLCLYLPSLREG